MNKLTACFKVKKRRREEERLRNSVDKVAPQLVELAYRSLLGREADADGFSHWVRRLKDGQPFEKLLEEFLRSSEYRRRATNALPVVADTINHQSRFAVLGNCQSRQMSRAIQALTGGALPLHKLVHPHASIPTQDGEPSLSEIFESHERIFLQPWLWNEIKPLYGRFSHKVVLYPVIVFSAFHPDLVYVAKPGGETYFRGPLMDYNSSIALLGWRAGLTAAQTVRLFRPEIYRRLEFFDWWESSRTTLLAEGAACGLDLQPLLETWARRGCFMHSINHPKLHVIGDIARLLLNELSIPLRPGNAVEFAHDFLADSAVWPIYPEIGEYYGLPGPHHYIFKPETPGFVPDSDVKVFSLEEMVEGSYLAFSKYEKADLVCPRMELPAYRDLQTAIETNGLDIFRHLGGEASPTNPNSNPYRRLAAHQFWRKGVAQVDADQIDPVTAPGFTFNQHTPIAAAGSCFAQHIAHRLSTSGFNFLKTETSVKDSVDAGSYSARYGNIYTARQLLQLMERAYGRFKPEETAWLMPNGRYADPFRPTIEPEGFSSPAELETARSEHLAAVRRMFETLNVLVFTLGLTEAWRARADGAVFPVAPGVAAGAMDMQRYEFVNFTDAEVTADLAFFIDRLLQINPKARVILTVSPVALSASYEDRHVLVSNTYSKAVLRVAAERISQQYPCCDYFPSYEIITGSFNRGRYYAEDLRTVTPEGVNHVMRLFLRHYANAESSPAIINPEMLAEAQRALKIVCEEELLAAAISQ